MEDIYVYTPARRGLRHVSSEIDNSDSKKKWMMKKLSGDSCCKRQALSGHVKPCGPLIRSFADKPK